MKKFLVFFCFLELTFANFIARHPRDASENMANTPSESTQGIKSSSQSGQGASFSQFPFGGSNPFSQPFGGFNSPIIGKIIENFFRLISSLK